jgi:hypothetical protein
MGIKVGEVFIRGNKKYLAEYGFESIDIPKLSDKDFNLMQRLGMFSVHKEVYNYNVRVYYHDMLIHTSVEKFEVDELQQKMILIHDSYLQAVARDERELIRQRAIEEGHMPYSLNIFEAPHSVIRVECERIMSRSDVKLEKVGK